MTEFERRLVWEQQYLQPAHRLRWWPDEALLRFIGRRYGGDPTTDSVLEIGCGTGNNLRALRVRGFVVTGLDCSPQALALAKTLLNQDGPPFALVRDDRLTTVADASVNGIIDVRTLQHMTPDEHADWYHEIYRVLVPGGWFFSVHAADGMDWSTLFPEGPWAWCAPSAALIALMRHAQFTGIKIGITGWTEPVSVSVQESAVPFRENYYWQIEAERPPSA
jgi:SAM-dependent methyltransferase